MHDRAGGVVDEGRGGCIAVPAPRTTSARNRRSERARHSSRGDWAGLDIDARQMLLAAFPDAFNQHPLLERLHANPQTMPLGQLLGGQRWAKVAYCALINARDFRPHDRWMACGCLACHDAWTPARPGRSSILLGKPEDLTGVRPISCAASATVNRSAPARSRSTCTRSISAAHRNHRHQQTLPKPTGGE